MIALDGISADTELRGKGYEVVITRYDNEEDYAFNIPGKFNKATIAVK